MNATRTRESEIAANVKFWKSKGIAITKREVRKAIEALPEVEGYDFYLVIPLRVTCSMLWEMLGQKMHTITECTDEDFRFYHLERDANAKTYAVAARYSQSSDWHRHESPLAYEDKPVHYMTPAEYMVAALRWFEENGSPLDDEGSVTIFPRTRMTTGYVPDMGYSDGCVHFMHEPAQYSSGRSSDTNVGPREVVAEGQPNTESIRYNKVPPCRL